MIKNKGCCDLKYAKRLREIGVKQDSTWYWENTVGQKDQLCWRLIAKENCQFSDNSLEYYSAFTAAELGEMLPDTIQNNYNLLILKGVDAWVVYYKQSPWLGKDIYCYQPKDKSLSNAMAKMFIWLLEQGRIMV